VTATAPSSDGCGIAYDDLGSGEPALLFMTGWCSSRARWGEVAARCGKGRRVLNFEWRGHGDSSAAPGDFGTEEMVQDAVAAVEHAGVGSFVPCAASHSGWVALELRRRLPERVPKLVSVDWLVTEPSERYLDVVRQLQSPETWRGGRSTLFRIWAAGDESPPIRAALGVMGEQDEDMWMRSGRVIEGCYAEAGSPLEAWSALEHPPPVLHLYGQPPDPAYLAAQLEFAALHPWFTVQTVPARTHFAMIDSPRTVADAIERFVAA
jgi:pimeloyl-ACP methyl ester carboxylesterase